MASTHTHPTTLFPSLSAAGLILLVAGTAGASGAPITARQVEWAESSIAWGEAEADLDTPLDAILPVLADYAAYQDFMPNFRRSRVLAQRGTRARVYMEVSAAAGALTLWGQLDLKARTEIEADTRVIEAQLLEGNIDAFRAEWRLVPSADGQTTHVAFRIFVDPDLPLPSSLISRENERAARRSVEALRSHLERKVP